MSVQVCAFLGKISSSFETRHKFRMLFLVHKKLENCQKKMALLGSSIEWAGYWDISRAFLNCILLTNYDQVYNLNRLRTRMPSLNWDYSHFKAVTITLCNIKACRHFFLKRIKFEYFTCRLLGVVYEWVHYVHQLCWDLNSHQLQC